MSILRSIFLSLSAILVVISSCFVVSAGGNEARMEYVAASLITRFDKYPVSKQIEYFDHLVKHLWYMQSLPENQKGNKAEILRILSLVLRTHLDVLRQGGALSKPKSPLVSSQKQAVYKNLLTEVNKERKAAGLSSLQLDRQLSSIAQAHADDMAATDHFDHVNLAGEDLVARVKRGGYSYWMVAENIAYGQKSAASVMSSRMESPSHKMNILDAEFTEMGVGYNAGYWVQIFAKPRR